MNKLLQAHPLVVLLGISPDTITIISTLNKKYDITPYVYSDIRPHYIPGVLKYKFIRLKYIENSYYIVHKLIDFISQENNRHTALLIPLTKRYNDILETNSNELESSYIVKSYNDLISIINIISRKV